jgi:hypothetical protein
VIELIKAFKRVEEVVEAEEMGMKIEYASLSLWFGQFDFF